MLFFMLFPEAATDGLTSDFVVLAAISGGFLLLAVCELFSIPRS